MPDSQFAPLTPMVESERRDSIRVDDDRKLHALLVPVATILFAVGAAWGTSQASLHQKQDRLEQVTTDGRQDRSIDSVKIQLGELLGAVRDVKTAIDSANLRLRQMKCEGQPPSCR